MNPRRIASLIAFAILGLVILFSAGSLLEDVAADENTVIQSPVYGQLDWYTTPGLKWQGFGTVTAYKKRSIYEFKQGAWDEKLKIWLGGIVVRFNDGGHGTIFGSIQYQIPCPDQSPCSPAEQQKLTNLHSNYRGQAAVHSDLLKTVTNKAIYLVGTLMSSKESYAEKRPDLIHYVNDMVQNGVYRTRQWTEWVTDPVTNERKQVTKAEIVMDKDGKPERQEESVLGKYGILAFNFTIDSMPYDEVVEKQIRQQQEIAMNMQTSAAQAKMAEQSAITAEMQGKADATKAKWEQETLKAKAVTLAQQEKEVQETNAKRDQNVQVINAERNKRVAELGGEARLQVSVLDTKSAEQTKQANILLGEGEAARKKLVIEADGALEQKLAAWERTMPKIFESLRGSAMVPSVVMGNGGGKDGQTTTTLDFLNILTVKAAKDLALDMSIPSGAKSVGQR